MNRYDCVIDLQGLIKSAIVARTLSKNCVGFDKNAYESQWRHGFIYDHHTPLITVKMSSNATFYWSVKLFHFRCNRVTQKEPFLFSQTSSDLHPHLLIVVGSSWESKIYPKEHFVTLINAP